MCDLIEMPDQGLIEEIIKHVKVGSESEPWVAYLEQILSIATRYPTELLDWDEVKVEEILLWGLPRNGTFRSSDYPTVGQAVVELLRRLPKFPGAYQHHIALGLVRHAENLLPKFEQAMQIKGRWGQNKRIFDNREIDLHDALDMQDMTRRIEKAMRAFNALSGIQRARALGPSITPAPQIVGRIYEPLHATASEELIATALTTTQVNRLVALIEFIGAGIKLTQVGNLKLADGKALVQLLGTRDQFDREIGERIFRTSSTQELFHLDRIITLAKTTGLLKVRNGTLSTTRKAHTFTSAPVTAIKELLDAHLKMGWDLRQKWMNEFLDFAAVTLLLDLYEVRIPMSIADIHAAAALRQRSTFNIFNDGYGIYQMHNMLLESDLRYVLIDLIDLGILTIDPADAFAYDSERYWKNLNVAEATNVTASLTTLGLAVVHSFAAAYGMAPLISSLSGLGADALLLSTLERATDEAEAEVANWLLNASEMEVAGFGEVLVTASRPAQSLGLRALIAAGERASPAIHVLESDPRTATIALIWRVETEQPYTNPTCASDLEWIELLHTVLITRGAAALATWVFHASGDQSISALLERVWRNDSPRTEEVLAGLTVAPLEKDLSKQARKALFRRRSRDPGSQ